MYPVILPAGASKFPKHRGMNYVIAPRRDEARGDERVGERSQSSRLLLKDAGTDFQVTAVLGGGGVGWEVGERACFLEYPIKSRRDQSFRGAELKEKKKAFGGAAG